MADMQHEGFLDDDGLRVAAVGVFAAEQRAVVGTGEAVVAVLLLAFAAGRTMAAAVDHAADAGEVARLELADPATDGNDAADDLVTGHRRIKRVLPLVAGGVDVRMADAAIEDLDLHIVRARVAPFDLVGGQRAAGVEGRISLALDHGFSLPWSIPRTDGSFVGCSPPEFRSGIRSIRNFASPGPQMANHTGESGACGAAPRHPAGFAKLRPGSPAGRHTTPRRHRFQRVRK